MNKLLASVGLVLAGSAAGCCCGQSCYPFAPATYSAPATAPVYTPPPLTTPPSGTVITPAPAAAPYSPPVSGS